MAHSYNYSVLQAVPDTRRDERVNIGLVVFRENDLDIRVCASRKLTALTSRSWDADIQAFGELIQKLDDPSLPAEKRNEYLRSVQDSLTMTAVGWFEARNADEYDAQMKETLKTLVVRPRRKRTFEGHSVVAEISAELRRKKLLASRNDQLDSGLVFRGLDLGHGLEADFAQKNSQFHVAAVLDLRANNPQLAQAALKAVVLDRAAHEFDNVHKVGIYAAATSRMGELEDNLAILEPYANDLLNWENPLDRRKITRLFADAYRAHHKEDGSNLFA